MHDTCKLSLKYDLKYKYNSVGFQKMTIKFSLADARPVTFEFVV